MSPVTAAVIDVQIACDDRDIPATEQIEAWVSRALAVAGVPNPEVSVRVVDTSEMQALNRDYREKDQPTNVLSFPAGRIQGLPADTVQVLGDIVVCAAVVSREAAEQGKSVADHWAHMLVHGTLHLAGYDHDNDVEASEMETLERKILQEYGLADPYGESR